MDEKTTLTDGTPVTEDHRELNPETGMQKGYVVLSTEERAKGFVEPVRQIYTHILCGAKTNLSLSIAETFARDPSFYGGTFCAFCKIHFDLDQFKWDGTNQTLGTRSK